ncbi:MAG: hypothetical protein LUC22_02725, partial [Prevotella sp.]|nr:hypothetical protein [Prevotella sp.]
MEQKDIRYSGFGTLPDDYQCPDGALAFASNCVVEDGGIKNIPDETSLRLIVGRDAKVFIHHTVNYYHYIIVYQRVYQSTDSVLLFCVDRDDMNTYLDGNGGAYVYCVYNSDIDKFLATTDVVSGVAGTYDYQTGEHNNAYAGTFVSLTCVANTLVLSTSESIHYFLCKPGTADETSACDHPYIYLGDKVPSVDIQFALKLMMKQADYEDVEITKEKIGSVDVGTDN